MKKILVISAFAVLLILTASGFASAQIPAYKSWLVNGPNLYTLAPNVGIGTTNPSDRLSVVGGDIGVYNGYSLSVKNAAGVEAGTISSGGSGSDNLAIRQILTGGHMSFHTGATEKMRITSSGKVGIGTTNPTVRLHVRAQSGAEEELLHLENSEGTRYYFKVGNAAAGQSFIIGGNAGDNLAVTAGGNIGIGTASPSTKITIKNNAAAASQVNTLLVQDAADESQMLMMRSRSTGDIHELIVGNSEFNGVTLSSEETGTQFVRLPSSRSAIFEANRGNANSYEAAVNFKTGGTGYFSVGLDDDTTNKFHIGSGAFASKYLTIDTSGNVGIGTTNPAEKLSVAGVVESTSGGIKFPDGTVQTSAAGGIAGTGTNDYIAKWSGSGSLGNSVIFQDSGGNVGIGTTTPAEKLDVSGNITVSGGGRITGTGSVPSGMIAFFAGSCPSGWTEYTALRGRLIVGTPAGGTNEGAVGTPLTNLQNPAHSHTYNQVIAHTHTVDPPAAASGSDFPSHSHSIDPPSTSTNNAGNHQHNYGSSITISNGNGFTNTVVAPTFGFGSYPTNSAGDHNHNVDIFSFTSGGPTLSHSHFVDIPQFTTGATGASSASTSSESQTMPYIQLTACQAP